MQVPRAVCVYPGMARRKVQAMTNLFGHYADAAPDEATEVERLLREVARVLARGAMRQHSC